MLRQNSWLTSSSSQCLGQCACYAMNDWSEYIRERLDFEQACLHLKIVVIRNTLPSSGKDVEETCCSDHYLYCSCHSEGREIQATQAEAKAPWQVKACWASGCERSFLTASVSWPWLYSACTSQLQVLLWRMWHETSSKVSACLLDDIFLFHYNACSFHFFSMVSILIMNNRMCPIELVGNEKDRADLGARKYRHIKYTTLSLPHFSTCIKRILITFMLCISSGVEFKAKYMEHLGSNWT